MARLADAMGAKNMSAMYQERIYKSNANIENLHLMITKYIAAENHAKVIQYAPELIYMDDRTAYYDFIGDVNDLKFANAADYSAEIQVIVSNEDNYLTTQYIKSLLAKNKPDEAKQALKTALAVETIRLDSPSMAYFTFTNDYYDEFEAYFEKYEQLYNNETEYEKLNTRGQAVADYYYNLIGGFFDGED